jgi:predicted MFS family arabinose efflux permease
MSTLLTIRFIQGFAVSGIGTMTRALVVDCYEDSQFKKMSSYLTLAWATGPVLSPVLGGYLQHHLDWQAPFYFLTIYSAMLIVLISFMPEPSLEKQSINVNKIIINYKTVLSHPMFWGWIIMSILFYSFIVIFGVVGSFLVQTVLGYSAVTYGHVALSLGLVWFAGNLLNRFSIHFRAARLIPMVIFYTLIANIITVVLASSLKMSLYTMVIPILFITLGASFLFSYSYSGTLSLFKHIAGTVSALMGAVLATGTGIISSLASILRTHNQVSMVLCYFGFVVVIAITYFLLVHPQLKKDEPCKTLTEE